jgi:hypothetical protein
MKSLTSKEKRAIVAAIDYWLAGYAARRNVEKAQRDLLDVRWENDVEIDPIEMSRLANLFD